MMVPIQTTMNKNIFITGNSRGVGRGLSQHYLKSGDCVYGLSRNGSGQPVDNLYNQLCDLSKLDDIKACLHALLATVDSLELVVLNAGVLGRIDDLHRTPIDELKNTMDINLWANKQILDYFIEQNISIRQIVLVSSGAAVNGNRGWNGYALSKAALNMLTQLYAHELPLTHLAAFAPGLVDTEMQNVLCNEVDQNKFPSILSLIDARGTDNMPNPEQAAARFADVFKHLLQLPSGGFYDIRSM